MVDQSVYKNYFEAVKRCSLAAQSDFEKVLALVDLNNIAAAIALLEELLPGIVEMYGNAAATAAAEMYEAVLLAETGKATTAYLAATESEKMRGAVGYAASLLSDGKVNKAITMLRKNIDYYVKEPARQTVTESAKRDGVRWARVPQGRETCGWCVLLASRGFVYHSEHTAHGYHANCDCMPVPSTKADTVIDGYDQKGYEEMYLEARRKVKGGGYANSKELTTAIANQLRNDLYEQNKDHVNAVKRQWWAENKDEQNAKRRKKAAAQKG